MPVTNIMSGFVVNIRHLHWFNWWYCEPSTLHITHKLGMKIDKFKYQKFIASIVCTYQKLHNQRWNQDQSGSVFFEGDCWLFHLEEAATFWAWPDSVLMSSGCKLTHSWKVKVIEVHLSESESGWGLPEWKWKWLRSTWVPSSPASHLAAVTVGFQRFLVGGKRSSCVQFIFVFVFYQNHPFWSQCNYNDKVSKKWKCRPLDWSLSLDLKASCLHPWYSEADRFYWRHRQPVGAGKFNLGGGKGGILTTNWMQWGWKWWSTSLAFKVVIYLSDIHGRLVGDPAVTLSQSWRVVRGERVKVGVVEPNLDRSSKVEDMIDISFWSPSAWSASCSTS